MCEQSDVGYLCYTDTDCASNLCINGSCENQAINFDLCNNSTHDIAIETDEDCGAIVLTIKQINNVRREKHVTKIMIAKVERAIQVQIYALTSL